MKNLSLLRNWTKVLFVLALVPIIFMPALLIIYFFFPDAIPFTFSTLGSTQLNVVKWLVILAVITGYFLFVYSLYLFKKVLLLFARKQIFHIDVIKYFYQMGKLIYYSLFIGAVPSNLYLFFTQKTHELDSEKLFGYVLVGSLGLFFMVLSEVFQMAKQLQEENDLTV